MRLPLAALIVALTASSLMSQQPAQPNAASSPPPLPASLPASTDKSGRPVAATYLYIEPYQTRLESLFGAEMLFGWVGESASPAVALTPEQQVEITKRIAGKAEKWCSLKEDGNNANGRLVSVSFVKGEPGRTEPMAEGEKVTPAGNMVGLVWEFATSPAPRVIEAQWWEWNRPISSLPMKIFFGRLSENMDLTRDLNFVKWQNEGRLPTPKPLAEVPPLPPVTFIPLPVATVVWLMIGIAYYVLRNRTGRKPRGGWLGMVIAWVFVAAILTPMGSISVRNPADKEPAPITTADEAGRIASPLLRNIYRSFDYQTESQVYDSLARSVDGELLRQLYLDIKKSLAIDEREGTRVKVSEVDVQIDKVTPGKGLTFTAEGMWTALGTVGHWGHAHTRVNRYNARVTVSPVGTEWKITGLEVLEVKRL